MLGQLEGLEAKVQLDRVSVLVLFIQVGLGELELLVVQLLPIGPRCSLAAAQPSRETLETFSCNFGLDPSVRRDFVLERRLVGSDLELAAARGSEHEVVVPDEPLQRNSWVPLLEPSQALAGHIEDLGRPPHRLVVDVLAVVVFLLLLELEVKLGLHLSYDALVLAVLVGVRLLEVARGLGRKRAPDQPLELSGPRPQ